LQQIIEVQIEISNNFFCRFLMKSISA